MIKYVHFLAIFVLFLIACQNTPKQEEATLKIKEESFIVPENAYHFKGVEHNYYIQFENKGKRALITSKHLNKSLERRNTWAQGAEYGKDSITLFTGVKENALIINGIKESLNLINPRITTYTNDSLFAIVEFHDKPKQNYALIRIEDGPYVKLSEDSTNDLNTSYSNEEFILKSSKDSIRFIDMLGSEIRMYKVQ